MCKDELLAKNLNLSLAYLTRVNLVAYCHRVIVWDNSNGRGIMMEKVTLNEKDLQQKLIEMAPQWKTGMNDKGVPYIERICHAKHFMQGIDFVRKVAEMAEAENHHPDIFINYKRITIRYWTHTASGVTLADVQMAKLIDPLFED